MTWTIVRRLLSVIPVMAVVAVFVFLLLHLAPGDPAAIMAGDRATPENIAAIRTRLGLDLPIWRQFLNWIGTLLHGAHYVIDTSRNGLATAKTWCNPPGQALGAVPTVNTGRPLADALLWIKPPGVSDGACNGGPQAGVFWPAYALSLAANAHW